MSRAVIILNSYDKRQYAARQIMQAPDFSRVEIKAAKRTLPQNALMWALLTKVSANALLKGDRYPPDAWKAVFLTALGKEMQFIPTLDENNFMPLGHSSSDLTIDEMNNLIEFIFAWCAQKGIVIDEQKAIGAAA
jgi:hypothetical protein